MPRTTNAHLKCSSSEPQKKVRKQHENENNRAWTIKLDCATLAVQKTNNNSESKNMQALQSSLIEHDALH